MSKASLTVFQALLWVSLRAESSSKSSVSRVTSASTSAPTAISSEQVSTLRKDTIFADYAFQFVAHIYQDFIWIDLNDLANDYIANR